MAHFDRYDIPEAHAVFSHEFHGGQGCELYKRLSKANGMLAGRSDLRWTTLSDNGREIYAELCERFNRVNPNE